MSIDLSSADMQHNPYPTYAQMRQQTGPVRADVGFSKNAYFITRYADAVMVLKDPRFVNDARKLPNWDDWTKKWYIPSVLKGFINSMALADEPDHTRLRGLVHKAFTPSMIQELSARIEQMTNEYLDAAARRPVVDFIADFALPLPLNVIADMMGVSAGERDRFRRYMSNTIADVSPGDGLKLVPKLWNAFGLNGLLKRMVDDRRRSPKDDLTTALVQAEEGGNRLSEAELMAMLFLILFAGHETTVNLIGSGLLALLEHPDQFELLKTNPDLIEDAIEELLRYTNPVQHIAMRYPIEDVEMGGTVIPRYSTVMVGVAAANRDETVFENPDDLDITRSPNRHIAFGFGIHYCVGAPLARLEARIAFSTLLRRFPNSRLAEPIENLKWRGAPALRGLTRLPIRLNG